MTHTQSWPWNFTINRLKSVPRDSLWVPVSCLVHSRRHKLSEIRLWHSFYNVLTYFDNGQSHPNRWWYRDESPTHDSSVKLAVSPDDRLNSLLIFTNPFSHVQFHLHSTGQRPNIHILNKKKNHKKMYFDRFNRLRRRGKIWSRFGICYSILALSTSEFDFWTF